MANNDFLCVQEDEGLSREEMEKKIEKLVKVS